MKQAGLNIIRSEREREREREKEISKKKISS
jgi:hypothetical protein